jgi:phage-related holin
MMDYYSVVRYVAAALHDFFVEEKCPGKLFRELASYLLTRDLEFLRLNKLVVALGLLMQKCHSVVNDLTLQRIRRYLIYVNEARNIYENLAYGGVDVVVIKTISSFPKDVSDIDLLIASKEDLEKASRIMRKVGYYLAKPGLEQDLWRRIVNGVVVDVEIHTNIAAANYEYYPKKLVFERAVLLNGVKVPSPVDSVLITASHMVMKDLYITLSDVLELEVVLKKYIGNEEVLIEEAKKLGLKVPLLSMLYYSSVINPRVSHRLSTWQKVVSSATLRRYYARPIPSTIALSYFHSILSRVRRESLGKVLGEVVSLPRGKGIDAFVYYTMGYKPTVKCFEE